MRIFLFSLSVLVFSLYSSAQKLHIGGIDDPVLTNEFLFIDNQDSSLIIDYDLTTNKEYLTYLTWIYNVWIDYPETYQMALPDLKYRTQVFDPMHAHDPVLGVSFNQAEKYCEWRTDRYNEFILVREGILDFDINQQAEDNFNTCAYLTGQYMGLVKSNLIDIITGESRGVIHSDYFLLPSFHIPTEQEIEMARKQLLKAPITEFKSVKSPLDKWLVAFLERMVYQTESSADTEHPLYKYYQFAEKVKNKEGWLKPKGKNLVDELNKQNISEIQLGKLNTIQNPENYYQLDINIQGEEIYYSGIYKPKTINPFLMKNQEELQEKDSIGRMPFIWIADEVDGSPILIHRYESNTDEQSVNNGFFCAVNIPYRMYLKRKYNYTIKNQPYLYKD